MIISPISFVNSHNNIQFKGNTMPEAVSKATKEVLRELDINTGTSYAVKLLREPQNAHLVESWKNVWKTLIDNIPFADTVEKLELIKTYGISFLRYTKDEMSQFLKFLQSNPSDKDVFFLKTAMDVARNGEIARIKNGESHTTLDDFDPVLEYVLSANKNERINLTSFSKSVLDNHYDRMHNVLCSDIRTTKKDADDILSAINKLLSNKIIREGFEYRYDMYGETSLKAELDNKYIVIQAIKNKDGNPEIIVGYSKTGYTYTPIDRQMYILLDKDNKLSKLKLFTYLRIVKPPLYKYLNKESSDMENYKYYDKAIHDYLTTWHADLSLYESPFNVRERMINKIRFGVNHGKYMTKMVDYDAATKIATLTDYTGDSIMHAQEYKLVDKSSDKLGIMVNENNPTSFMPIEPTNYDLEQMINNERTNNLLKVLNFSGFNDCFMRIIEVLSN